MDTYFRNYDNKQILGIAAIAGDAAIAIDNVIYDTFGNNIYSHIDQKRFSLFPYVRISVDGDRLKFSFVFASRSHYVKDSKVFTFFYEFQVPAVFTYGNFPDAHTEGPYQLPKFSQIFSSAGLEKDVTWADKAIVFICYKQNDKVWVNVAAAKKEQLRGDAYDLAEKLKNSVWAQLKLVNPITEVKSGFNFFTDEKFVPYADCGIEIKEKMQAPGGAPDMWDHLIRFEFDNISGPAQKLGNIQKISEGTIKFGLRKHGTHKNQFYLIGSFTEGAPNFFSTWMRDLEITTETNAQGKDWFSYNFSAELLTGDIFYSLAEYPVKILTGLKGFYQLCNGKTKTSVVIKQIADSDNQFFVSTQDFADKSCVFSKFIIEGAGGYGLTLGYVARQDLLKFDIAKHITELGAAPGVRKFASYTPDFTDSIRALKKIAEKAKALCPKQYEYIVADSDLLCALSTKRERYLTWEVLTVNPRTKENLEVNKWGEIDFPGKLDTVDKFDLDWCRRKAGKRFLPLNRGNVAIIPYNILLRLVDEKCWPLTGDERTIVIFTIDEQSNARLSFMRSFTRGSSATPELIGFFSCDLSKNIPQKVANYLLEASDWYLNGGGKTRKSRTKELSADTSLSELVKDNTNSEKTAVAKSSETTADTTHFSPEKSVSQNKTKNNKVQGDNHMVIKYTSTTSPENNQKVKASIESTEGMSASECLSQLLEKSPKIAQAAIEAKKINSVEEIKEFVLTLITTKKRGRPPAGLNEAAEILGLEVDFKKNDGKKLEKIAESTGDSSETQAAETAAQNDGNKKRGQKSKVSTPEALSTAEGTENNTEEKCGRGVEIQVEAAKTLDSPNKIKGNHEKTFENAGGLEGRDSSQVTTVEASLDSDLKQIVTKPVGTETTNIADQAAEFDLGINNVNVTSSASTPVTIEFLGYENTVEGEIRINAEAIIAGGTCVDYAVEETIELYIDRSDFADIVSKILNLSKSPRFIKLKFPIPEKTNTAFSPPLDTTLTVEGRNQESEATSFDSGIAPENPSPNKLDTSASDKTLLENSEISNNHAFTSDNGGTKPLQPDLFSAASIPAQQFTQEKKELVFEAVKAAIPEAEKTAGVTNQSTYARPGVSLKKDASSGELEPLGDMDADDKAESIYSEAIEDTKALEEIIDPVQQAGGEIDGQSVCAAQDENAYSGKLSAESVKPVESMPEDGVVKTTLLDGDSLFDESTTKISQELTEEFEKTVLGHAYDMKIEKLGQDGLLLSAAAGYRLKKDGITIRLPFTPYFFNKPLRIVIKPRN